MGEDGFDHPLILNPQGMGLFKLHMQMSIPTTFMRSWSSLGRRQLPLCCPAGDAGGLHHQAGHQCQDGDDLNPDLVVGQAEQEASCLGSDGQGGSEGSLPALNLYPVASPHHHQSIIICITLYFSTAIDISTSCDLRRLDLYHFHFLQ